VCVWGGGAPIELIQGSLFPQLIVRDSARVSCVCWHAGGKTLFTPLPRLPGQRRHRLRRVFRRYTCAPIVGGLRPGVHHSAAISPASLISHYRVSAAASLSTPPVMYGLALCGVRKAPPPLRSGARERPQRHLAGRSRYYTGL